VICHRCGATVPEELPICGSCGQDLTIPNGRDGARVFGGDTEPTTEISEVSGLSGPLQLRDAGMAAKQQGLPYTTGDLVIDRYQIDDVIAEGPVGVVYSAVDLDMDVQIALKVILSEYFPDANALAQFSRSMSQAQEMSHENIVRIYDTAPDESRFLIAQRLIMGRSLSEVLAERLPQSIASPSDEVRSILTQIGEGLAYAHPDTPHGALKPTNVILLPAGLKLTDFCLGASIAREAYMAGHRHRRLPTRYLAPEFAAGRQFDHRADLYSLAVIGFELLTGVPLPEDPERQQTALTELPASTRKMIDACLSRSPNGRPDDVDDLVEAMLEAVDTDSYGVPNAASLAVGDSTNVLDLGDVEVLEDDDNDDDDPLEADFLSEGESTDPSLRRPEGSGQGTVDDGDTLVKHPSQDAWPDSPIHRHTIPPAEPSTDQFERVDPAHLVTHGDPENFIEAAEDIRHVPDINLDGRGVGDPNAGLRSKRPVNPRSAKVKEAIEAMDFEASLEDALASASRVPPPKKRRKKKRGPGYDPDPEAMQDRPVAAAGVTLAATQNSKLHLPAFVEPAVTVEPQPTPSRGGTAQIPIPEQPRSRAGLWIGLAIFGLLCIGGTVGVIVYKHTQDKNAAEAKARQRARIRALAFAQQDLQVDPDGHGSNTGTMALPIMGTQPSMSNGGSTKKWRRGCPVGAIRFKNRRRRLHFCIDRYEFPGTRGTIPQTALDEDEAARLCRSQGKRLCTRTEWQWACGGKRKRLFSYGKNFKRGVCATAGPANQKLPITPTGSHPRCRTADGIHDLNGNVAEWVKGSQLMGGSAGKPGNQTSCRSDGGAGGSAYYGIRCCATPRKR
jgi:eukaryotic-like serine/threonine-protein kinase